MLIQCPTCQHKISRTASACPSCGEDFNSADKTREKRTVLTCFALFWTATAILLVYTFFLAPDHAADAQWKQEQHGEILGFCVWAALWWLPLFFVRKP